jgi:hypothetical protein
VNNAQRLWWEQSKSDLKVFKQLRTLGAHPCHLLHYLQMATEKISKAYLWRSGNPPPKVHTGFVRFLRALLTRPPRDLEWISKVLGFGRPEDLDKWVSTNIRPFAYDLMNIAPAEARNGPNPEYPWPHEAPGHCPATHAFGLWTSLSDMGRGRKFMDFVDVAISRFEKYA